MVLKLIVLFVCLKIRTMHQGLGSVELPACDLGTVSNCRSLQRQKMKWMRCCQPDFDAPLSGTANAVLTPF